MRIHRIHLRMPQSLYEKKMEVLGCVWNTACEHAYDFGLKQPIVLPRSGHSIIVLHRLGS